MGGLEPGDKIVDGWLVRPFGDQMGVVGAWRFEESDMIRFCVRVVKTDDWFSRAKEDISGRAAKRGLTEFIPYDSIPGYESAERAA